MGDQYLPHLWPSKLPRRLGREDEQVVTTSPSKHRAASMEVCSFCHDKTRGTSFLRNMRGKQLPSTAPPILIVL